MQRTSTIRIISIVTAFVGGVTLACQSGSSTNTEHCFNNDGDNTCAELYGDERPFCVGPGTTCDAAPDVDGCVAELPPDECYSPCGNGSLVADDPSCVPGEAGDGDGDGDGDTGDGDGDGDGDGEPNGDGDGDGDEPTPWCGDGIVAEDEECDDGNTVDDDECSNACTIAVCGDGIVQSAFGEICDDGNTEGADGCAASCVPSGTVVWSRYSDLPNATGRAVIVAGNGAIGVLAYSSDLGYRIVGLNADGETIWNEEAPSEAAGIATGRTGQFVVGGVVDGKGQVWKFENDGDVAWTSVLPQIGDSQVRDVAIDTFGRTYAVGSAFNAGNISMLNDNGAFEWSLLVMGSSIVDNVVAAPEGGAWLLRDNPRQVVRYDESKQLIWASDDLGTAADLYADLAADPMGNVYMVGNVAGGIDAFGVAKFDGDGETSWVSFHDHPDAMELGLGIAALPTGGAVVCGVTDSLEADALLSWYGPDGTLIQDQVIDGPGVNDSDWLQGIAVGPDGNVVVVGFHQPEGGDYRLWIMKVAF